METSQNVEPPMEILDTTEGLKTVQSVEQPEKTDNEEPVDVCVKDVRSLASHVHQHLDHENGS